MLCNHNKIKQALQSDYHQPYRVEMRTGAENPGLGSVCNIAGAAARRQKQCWQISRRCNMVPRQADTQVSQPEMSEDYDSDAHPLPRVQGVVEGSFKNKDAFNARYHPTTLWPSGHGVGLLSQFGLPARDRIPQVSNEYVPLAQAQLVEHARCRF